MEIREFPKKDGDLFRQAAALLEECFSHAYSGELARQQMELCLEEGRVSLMAWEEGRLLGFVGAMPQYGVTAWELHPLAVTAARRGEGIGAALVAALEREVAARGCLTLYLGTDDEFFQTSLSQGDLFEDTFEKIQNIRNLARHPYEFYQKQGFQIVGVLPDANGPGKPDIWMAKRVTPQDKSRRVTPQDNSRFGAAAKAAPVLTASARPRRRRVRVFSQVFFKKLAGCRAEPYGLKGGAGP